MGKNPTLLTLLKQGCKIEFPLGYVLQGVPEDRDIREFEVIEGKYYPQGLWTLDAGGVRLAMKDVKKYNSLMKLHNKLNK